MKKLIPAIIGIFTAFGGYAWAACSADIQMNANPPTNSSGNTITYVPLPVADTDVATKAYVDQYGRISTISQEQAAATLVAAADICALLEEGGHADWFLPSAAQLAGLPQTTSLSNTYWTTTPFLDSAHENSVFVTYTPSNQSVAKQPSDQLIASVCIR